MMPTTLPRIVRLPVLLRPFEDTDTERGRPWFGLDPAA